MNHDHPKGSEFPEKDYNEVRIIGSLLDYLSN